MGLNSYFAIIIALTIGGFSGVITKVVGLPATTITFFRVFVPAFILGVYFLWKKQNIIREHFGLMLLSSTLNAIRIFLYFVAYLFTTMSNAVIMLYTWPVFAAIFGIIFLKEKISRRTMILILLAFVGTVLMYVNQIVSLNNRDLIGMGAMFISAALYALTAIIFKKGLETYTNFETVFYQNIVGAIIFLPFIFINRPIPNFIQASSLTIYAFLIGFVGFGLIYYALKRIKVSHYSLFSYWEVVMAIIFGMIFFAEKLTWNMAIGGLMIIIAGILLRKKKK